MKKASLMSAAGMGSKGSDIRVGIDLGDKCSHWSAMDRTTGELRQGIVEMTREGIRACFGEMQQGVIVMEAGQHSYWVCRQLRALGHQAEVLPPDVLRQGSGKRRQRNDSKDADALREWAYDVGRARVKTLWQRSEEDQRWLMAARLRDAAVRARAGLSSGVRLSVKQLGERIRDCDVDYIAVHAREDLSGELLPLVEPMLTQIEGLSETIKKYDEQLEECLARRPEAKRLLELPGLGPVTLSVLMATAGDAARFLRSRDFPAYYGLVPGQDQSGEHDPQLRITKTGDSLGRKLLVEWAHRMMKKNAPDCALKRWALSLAGEGKNKIRKRKAVVALARKLATMLHRLWVSGEAYDPWYGKKAPTENAA